ncbi:MAG: ScyD/ScyE family protein [Nostoc sp. NOS(2021)]|uniref:ScyD/ScyE family protein n=1 Tax=Nostoc sp. NOS(2021) TaxID=2815407 RepID=UPI0025CE822F|nr:ScyD/ScyE family protein [Nostoc sp. NOS(2021)]MBN3898759.1 ScyD/ScyE family protein [Nostoc sp. NOS(2021)]
MKSQFNKLVRHKKLISRCLFIYGFIAGHDDVSHMIKNRNITLKRLRRCSIGIIGLRKKLAARRLLLISLLSLGLAIIIPVLLFGVLIPTVNAKQNSVSTNSQVRMSVVAKNLNNPRGLAFRTDGELYITEAGVNGQKTQIPGPAPGVILDFGLNGSVTRVYQGVQQRIIVDLQSTTVDPKDTQLVPSINGSSQTFGATDIAFDRKGDAYIILGYATNPIYRRNLGYSGANLASLLKINLTRKGKVVSLKKIADFAQYESEKNPSHDDLVSDPYSFLIQGSDCLVVDGGANDLLRVDRHGDISTEAVFNTRYFPNVEFPVQSVPTAITVGSDGAYYVGEFSGFPFLEGVARIFRLMPGQAPQVYAEGFTQIIDIAAAPDGGLYVLEHASHSLLLGDGSGALIYLSPSGQRTTLVSDGLVLPTAMTIGSDGAIYVSNYGSYAGIGQVVRIEIVS